jgi:hypothetical protein
MDTATISALSALAGTAIGGLTSGLTTLLNQSAQARAEQIRHDLSRREDLVRDFIVAASKTYGEALVTSEPQAPDLVNLYSMVSRMRVLAMPRSVASAEKLMLVIIDTYFQPNKTIRDLHEMMKTRRGVDPLWEFSDAARDELTAVKSR